MALGIGKNGGETALDGATFLSTIGWDWLAAVRDRDTGIWLPVTMDATGPVVVRDPFVTSELSDDHATADLKIVARLENKTAKAVTGTLVGTIGEVSFRRAVTVEANGAEAVTLDPSTTPELHVVGPRLWWPNAYGAPNLIS